MNNTFNEKEEGVMTPFDQVAERYGNRPKGRTFDADLCDHISNGYVVSTRDFFVMGRPVSRKGTVEQICNPAFIFPEERCDAWFVYQFAGPKRSCLQFVPYPLKWIAWGVSPEGAVRFYNYDSLMKGRR